MARVKNVNARVASYRPPNLLPLPALLLILDCETDPSKRATQPSRGDLRAIYSSRWYLASAANQSTLRELEAQRTDRRHGHPTSWEIINLDESRPHFNAAT